MTDSRDPKTADSLDEGWEHLIDEDRRQRKITYEEIAALSEDVKAQEQADIQAHGQDDDDIT
jgi:hypothetical protein